VLVGLVLALVLLAALPALMRHLLAGIAAAAGPVSPG
jgi:hypothetical protein